MLYLAYLDEFGHIGPYLTHDHPQHKTHPAFGLAGILLPYTQVRPFSSYFYRQKNQLLQWELERSGKHPAQWEKKGSSLFTLQNLRSYPEVRRTTFRLLNKLKNSNGRVFYVGIEKYRQLEGQNSKGLYIQILREAIKRLDQECASMDSHFILMLDQSEDVLRSQLVEKASISMFGADNRQRLIEPPIQGESHRYQLLQFADWICGIMGRLTKFWCEPEVHAELVDFEKYFLQRLEQCQVRCGFRRLCSD